MRTRITERNEARYADYKTINRTYVLSVRCSLYSFRATRSPPSPDTLHWFMYRASALTNTEKYMYKPYSQPITKWLLPVPIRPKTHPYETALQAVLHAIHEKRPCFYRRYDRTSRRLSVPILVTTLLQGIPTHYQHRRRITDHKNGLIHRYKQKHVPQASTSVPTSGGVLATRGKAHAVRASFPLRTLSVPPSKRPFKASRRVRTTLYRVW